MARGGYHQLPTADEAAQALVLAASVTGELGRLIAHPGAALNGSMPLAARWLAIGALQAIHFKVRPGDISRLVGIHDPTGALVGMAYRNGAWPRMGGVAVLAALVEAADGEGLSALMERLHALWPSTEAIGRG